MPLNNDAAQRLTAVLIGTTEVGKTRLCNAVINDNTSVYAPTIGMDFVKVTQHKNNQAFNIHLWDTAGQERFEPLLPRYTMNAQCLIAMFSYTNKESFDALNGRFRALIQESINKGTACIILGVNMNAYNRCISVEMVDELKNSFGDSTNIQTKSIDEINTNSADEVCDALIDTVLQQNKNLTQPSDAAQQATPNDDALFLRKRKQALKIMHGIAIVTSAACVGIAIAAMLMGAPIFVPIVLFAAAAALCGTSIYQRRKMARIDELETLVNLYGNTDGSTANSIARTGGLAAHPNHSTVHRPQVTAASVQSTKRSGNGSTPPATAHAPAPRYGAL